MRRWIFWIGLSAGIHAGAFAGWQALRGGRTGVSPAGAPGRGSPPIVRIETSPQTGSLAATDSIEERIRAVRELPVERRIERLRAETARAEKYVRQPSVAEVAGFLGIRPAARLQESPSPLRDLDENTLTILDVAEVSEGVFDVRLADGAGRWAILRIDDPEERESWRSAARAMEMVRERPILRSIYDRCVRSLLPEMPRTLGEDGP